MSNWRTNDGPPTQWQIAYSAKAAACTGHISVCCSALIIYSILGPGRKEKLAKPHMRLLLGMSLWDFFYSLFKAQAYWTAPPESGWEDARGNMQTCRLQGFFITFAHATGSYNAMLSTYYYLTICRGFKVKQWVTIEKFFHVIIFVFFFSLAAIGVHLEIYNPIFAFCYIQSVPPGCELSPMSPPCEKWPPETLGYMHEIWGQGAVQLSIFIVVLTNFLIWRKVKSQGQNMDRYGAGSFVLSRKQQQDQPPGDRRSFLGKFTSSVLARKAEEVGQDETEAVNQARENKKREQDARQRRERMVFVQCLLYSVAFLLCFIGPTIFHLAGWFWDTREFWHMGVLSTFTPLQGVFNAAIYARPIYLRIRNKFPHLSRWDAFWRVWLVADPLATDAQVLRAAQETSKFGALRKEQGKGGTQATTEATNDGAYTVRMSGDSTNRQTGDTAVGDIGESLRRPPSNLVSSPDEAQRDHEEDDDMLSLGEDPDTFERGSIFE